MKRTRKMSKEELDKNGLTAEQRERCIEDAKNTVRIAELSNTNFQYMWNWEYGKKMPSEVFRILLFEGGFQQLHCCSHNNGVFQAWGNGPMEELGWCTYCLSSYGERLETGELFDFRVLPGTKASLEDPATRRAVSGGSSGFSFAEAYQEVHGVS
jgi:hypothetical protein